MPWYRRFGKDEYPVTQEQFVKGMNEGQFIQRWHRSVCIALYYSAVRRQELSRSIRDQFRIMPNHILYDVGVRLKHSKKTPPLPIPLEAPFVDELEDTIISTQKGKRVFPCTDRTIYNITARVFKYPHWFRLSRITWFFMPHPEVGRSGGFSIAEVRSWTGLSLKALDYYIGLVGIEKMGEAMAIKPNGRDSIF